eukprot:m.105675 g.105675  ORF g.105675 m.105675 type:complete len:61 (+) comp51654_c0_seq1:1658-1840(+)
MHRHQAINNAKLSEEVWQLETRSSAPLGSFARLRLALTERFEELNDGVGRNVCTEQSEND